MAYSRDESINHLKEAFKDHNLGIYLGAGVSIENNLPTWEKLVLAMYFNKIGEQELGGYRPFSNYLYAIAEWYLKNSSEPLEITARKLQKYYTQNTDQGLDFLDDLYQVLYGSYLDEGGRPFFHPDSHSLRYNNKTLDAVARLCESNSKGVKSVITYNYDNLLEMALEENLYQSVFSADPIDGKKLPIYHVHGFVPFDKDIERSQGEDIVFTENQYHMVARNPYHWSTLVQLQSMTNTVGLMVGLSISDPNMRRLLDAVQNAPIKSFTYALLKVPENVPPEDSVLDDIHKKAKDYLDRFQNSGIKSNQNESMGIFYNRPGIKSAELDLKSSQQGSKGPKYRHQIAGIIEQVQRLEQEQQNFVLEQLGIRPIWFNDFQEISDILDQIPGN
jgi:hypothetical protein